MEKKLFSIVQSLILHFSHFFITLIATATKEIKCHKATQSQRQDKTKNEQTNTMCAKKYKTNDGPN